MLLRKLSRLKGSDEQYNYVKMYFFVSEKQYLKDLFQRFASFSESKLDDVSFEKMMKKLGSGIESFDNKHLFRYS